MISTATETQLSAADWQQAADDLDAVGCASTPRLLTPAQCRELAGLYDRPELFRATIDMARHRFGSGQYRYFTHDLPEPLRALREAFYPHLLTIAGQSAVARLMPFPAAGCLRGPGATACAPLPRRSRAWCRPRR